MKKNDLISRSELIERIKKLRPEAETLAEALYSNMLLDGVMSVLDTMPAVDPEELWPVGHWYDKGSLSCRCSRCGCKNGRESNYRPNCGAKIEKQTKKYRNKSEVVEAVQWTGKNVDEIAGFCPELNMPKWWAKDETYLMSCHTSDGICFFRDGDYLVKEKGVYYMCRKDYFEKTYEPVEK